MSCWLRWPPSWSLTRCHGPGALPARRGSRHGSAGPGETAHTRRNRAPSGLALLPRGVYGRGVVGKGGGASLVGPLGSTIHVLRADAATIAALADCPWDPDTVKDAVFAVGEALGVNRSKSQAPVRVAVTGRSVGPPLFEPMVNHLTREEVLRRLQAARSRL